jgi:hypothetical protein
LNPPTPSPSVCHCILMLSYMGTYNTYICTDCTLRFQKLACRWSRITKICSQHNRYTVVVCLKTTINNIVCNENQPDALFIFNLFLQSTSTCFRHTYCPSSGGIHCICTAIGTCYTFQLTGNWPGQTELNPHPASCQSPKSIKFANCCKCTVNTVFSGP